jgi:deoxycytidine triphosphate deaminase
MLFVLSGPSGVGKSYSVEYLCGVFDFKTIAPYTTRKPRVSESEGFHYHFRSVGELKELTANFSVGYWARPLNDGHVYGYTTQVETLAEDSRNWIIQASTDIGLAIKKKFPTTVLVFLDFTDDDTLHERILERYSEESEEVVERRLRHAEHERAAKDKFDYVITSNSPEQIARELLQIILSRSSKLPFRSLSQPGPLADVDILASLEAPEGLRIEGVPKEGIEARINGWSVDLTLAPRFYRIIYYRRIFRRVFDLARGNSTDMLKRFRECVAQEGTGIYLKPQEFVLASTIERLSVPPRMVCLVTGRSSYARMGLSIELSQIVLQPGHDDVIPLQIKNNMPYPIIIYPEVSIVQAVFFNTISPSATPYNVQARAKYPRHADDVRSRYYLDPAYTRIRSTLPNKRPFDWDHLLNILLFLLTGLTAASWIATQINDPALAAAGKYLAILFFAITVLALIARLVRLFKKPS